MFPMVTPDGIETGCCYNHMCRAAKRSRGSSLLFLHRRLLAAAGLAFLVTSSAASPQGGPPAMPVTIPPPVAKRVTQWDEFSGRFEAVASVEVRARVSGFIDKLHFRDGQLVNVGDLLFTIDKRPFEIAVESAEAEVARNKAQVDLAELQVERGASLIATIVTLDPIRFVFDVSESDYLRYTRLFLSGAMASSRDSVNPVRIRLADETEWTRSGKVDFVDNTLSARSGTMRTRAIVENKNQLLTPGIFGRVQLFGGEYDALLIPDTAIVSDQSRKIVFTVNNDNVVHDGLANPMVGPGAKVVPQKGEIKTADAKATSN